MMDTQVEGTWCPKCGLLYSITTKSCGPYRGWWIDLRCYESVIDRWSNTTTRHAWTRLGARVSVWWMERIVRSAMKECCDAGLD